MKRHYPKLVKLAAVLLVDTLFFGLIDPRSAYALVVVIGYLLLVLTIYIIIDLLLVLVERIIPLHAMTRHRLLTSMTMLLALLVAMQSIGQLTLKDMAAIVPLVLVAGFYLSYQRKQAR